MTYDFGKYKDNSLTRPRDLAWDNWKSWKDSKIGDKVQGYIADAFYRPEEKDVNGDVIFREQRGITIKQDDGTLINVGVKFLEFVLSSTDKLRVGDPLTVEYTEEREPTSKARKGAKIFGFFGVNLPENADNPSVKELTDEDRKDGGSTGEEVEGTSDKDPAPDEDQAF